MTQVQTIIVCALGMGLLPALAAQGANSHYPTNSEPLASTRFVELPLGTVKPEGWLKDQLKTQADGATGHLDEFWPSLAKSAWRGEADGEAWERGPYYLDGLVPLAYLLDDARLLAKIKPWMEGIVTSGRPDGWFGPEKNKDRWPLAVALKVLTQYYEASGDERALKVIQNYFNYLHDNAPDWPDKDWRGARAMENVVTAFWLYRRTGDPKVLETAKSIYENSLDWTGYFKDLPYKERTFVKDRQFRHITHVVNIGMATKYPGIWSQYPGQEGLADVCRRGIADLDKYHGQVAGRFSGDEHLAGKSPIQGTELCAVVEYMFSLENLVSVLGDVALADRLELLAYNANPGAWTADCWGHQYDQQANQVLVSVAKRQWTNNSATANLYGLEPNFGCCTANMHQGWPKFVSHMWMASPDNGLAAVAYGPNRVTAKVGEGKEVTVRQKTDYPFDGEILFTVEMGKDESAAFPLYLRIPAWAEDALLTIGGEKIEAEAGTFVKVARTWKNGDTARLVLPMRLRTEERFNGGVSILRGPLYYALKIGEKRTALTRHHDTFPMIDWQIEPTTPWNYGLLIDPEEPGEWVTVSRQPIGPVPFATEAAPVVLKVKGRQIPAWGLVNDSADVTPSQPVTSEEPVAELELVPYGSTRLRITEFPVIEN